ncbi:MAG: hypothetical protein HXS52_00805 [Theionarchaea archaeon]|nr:hypothetical protein [Theionarchaea archaeon]
MKSRLEYGKAGKLSDGTFFSNDLKMLLFGKEFEVALLMIGGLEFLTRSKFGGSSIEN